MAVFLIQSTYGAAPTAAAEDESVYRTLLLFDPVDAVAYPVVSVVVVDVEAVVASPLTRSDANVTTQLLHKNFGTNLKTDLPLFLETVASAVTSLFVESPE